MLSSFSDTLSEVQGMGAGYIYVDEDTATDPTNGREMTGMWWLVHPEEGLAFYVPNVVNAEPKPQANRDRRVAAHLRDKLAPDLEVRYVAYVFIAHAHKARRSQTPQPLSALTEKTASMKNDVGARP